MKRICLLLITLLLLLGQSLPSLAGDVRNPSGLKPLFNFMVKAETIDMSIFDEFALAHDIKINPIYYTTAYLLFIRMRQGTERDPVDLVATQYYNQRILQTRVGLRELDHTLIPNLSSMPPALRNISDMDHNNKYTVPIAGGVMCLLVNSKQLNPAKVGGYADLWRSEVKGKILIPEDFSNLMPLALKMAGEAMDSQDEACLERAWRKVTVLLGSSRIVTNNALEWLDQENDLALALVYSNDAYHIMRLNPNWVMVTPREGYLGWVESVSIPQRTKNFSTAHDFINYLLEPAVQARLCLQVGYLPVTNEAYALMNQAGRPPLMAPADFLESIALVCDLPHSDSYHEKWRALVEERQTLR